MESGVTTQYPNLSQPIASWAMISAPAAMNATPSVRVITWYLTLGNAVAALGVAPAIQVLIVQHNGPSVNSRRAARIPSNSADGLLFEAVDRPRSR